MNDQDKLELAELTLENIGTNLIKWLEEDITDRAFAASVTASLTRYSYTSDVELSCTLGGRDE